jgi:hypothetical protein
VDIPRERGPVEFYITVLFWISRLLDLRGEQFEVC